MISDSEEITGKIVNILAYQAVITAQGENYTGEKDWALNKLRDLFKEELQKAVQEEKLKHCCCLLEDSKVVERCKLHGEELQKARYDWLREEIMKLEGMKKTIDYTDSRVTALDRNKYYRLKGYEQGSNKTLQTIIDRYHSELDQDKKYTMGVDFAKRDHSELDHLPDRPLNS